MARLAIRIVDHPRNVYCVLSSDEVATFVAAWSIDERRVVFTPFFVTLFSHWDSTPTAGDYVFAGGESLRDHELLLEAVDGLDVDVHIAAGNVPPTSAPNVHAGRVAHDRFMELLLGCAMVVVALKPSNRSAGQQTYLNAMALGKPVVVTDAPGVRDYIDDGRTGFIVPPDAGALRTAIVWVLDPANAERVAAVAAAGRAEARGSHDADTYRRRLLVLADRIAGGR
jgi:glycosyltransferase involved in cell wall biosynthesis